MLRLTPDPLQNPACFPSYSSVYIALFLKISLCYSKRPPQSIPHDVMGRIGYPPPILDGGFDSLRALPTWTKRTKNVVTPDI